MTLIVAVTSDWHVNSYAGLSPEHFTVTTEHGRQRVRRSAGQDWLWEQWLAYWKRIRTLKAKLDAEVVAVINGDGPDLNRYTTRHISPNPADIITATVAVAQPLVEVADYIHMVTGTTAHAGPHNELEAIFAERIGAQKTEHGAYIRRYLALNHDGVRLWFEHAPISNSTRSYTRGGGANRTANEMVAQWYVKRQKPDEAPQVAIFGHVHHHEDSGDNFPIRVLFSDPFCLLDAWIKNKGRAGYVAEVGGVLCIIENGALHVERFVRQTKDDTEWWTLPKIERRPTQRPKNFIRRWLNKSARS